MARRRFILLFLGEGIVASYANTKRPRKEFRPRSTVAIVNPLFHLIAEMGGAYLCAEAGISSAVITNQAAYVAGWLKKWRARHFLSNQQEDIM